ncbi:bifunctional homocysteine S-methyltransferase/methylenetetrahydrofolate reductase [Oligosphaera ethanolica]|uniref:Homocysteine S-methyltransferase n=1 Tax=Oligosphaera ethanolica TaxID=760260 RepID=A0AAE3VH26_9BACT|nr:bifunctional homocysteine S-methyltransferase/methylenetetrahydrofolate reductase [Oligosphaera ethanolica]MDQ0290250.1 homocysteine S-methyltransferase [Oligosphaera ethanolica]
MTSDDLVRFFTNQLVIFDGATGTELYRRHVFTNRCYDELCLSEPKLVSDIYRDYLRAGADVLTTNSFGAQRLALKKFGLADKCSAINEAAARLARQAVEDQHRVGTALVAGSLGPIATTGTSSAERIDMWLEQARGLLAGGADLLLFETLPNREAADEARSVMQLIGGDQAYILSHAVADDGDLDQAVQQRLLMPDDGRPLPAVIGFNCGMGPDKMLSILEIAVKYCDRPLLVQPNAGAPQHVDFRQLYLCSPEYLTTYALRYIALGARAVGGCCGTTPEHIADLARSVKPLGKSQQIAQVIAKAAPTETPQAEEVPLAERSRFGRKLAAGEWVTTVEISPPRGWQTADIVAKAKLCQEAGVDVINIPDGPRAAPRMSSIITALHIQQQAGIEAVLHVCGRDRNFIGLQADLLGCAGCGIHNFLFITGDPPKLGNYGFASGVFDTDSIGLAKLQKDLNRGFDFGGQKIDPPTAAVIGVGADPNAIDFQREIDRLRQKAAAGADFVTTQPVFDPDALKRFVEAIADLHLPVIAGIWPLASLRNALFMKNEVPGVVVPDAIITRMEAANTREEQLATGIAIAREAVAAVRPYVAGVQVSAPLGNVRAALAVLAP